MYRLIIVGLFLLASCSHNERTVNIKKREGRLLNPEYYHSNLIQEEGTPKPKETPLTYYRYDDTISPGAKAKYNIYGNACVENVSYRDLSEHKIMLKDSLDGFKFKSYSFYFIAINHSLIDESNPYCKQMVNEDRILYSFEVPVGTLKSFLDVFLSPSLEIRRVD
jgi:hypothetical protein